MVLTFLFCFSPLQLFLCGSDIFGEDLLYDVAWFWKISISLVYTQVLFSLRLTFLRCSIWIVLGWFNSRQLVQPFDLPSNSLAQNHPTHSIVQVTWYTEDRPSCYSSSIQKLFWTLSKFVCFKSQEFFHIEFILWMNHHDRKKKDMPLKHI